MNHNFRYYLLLFLLGSFTQGFAASVLEQSSYWLCRTHDNTNKQWSARNLYQKAAFNIAFASCKKESTAPASCVSSINDCEGYNQGMSTKPMWRCTALDQTADSWQSNFYRHRDEAALAAKAYCRSKSVVPDTCYINMITCTHTHEEEQL